MPQRKAVVTQGPGKVAVETIELPAPGPEQIIVKVSAIGLNPTDWKTLDYVTAPGSIIGCDYAGIVERVGANVTDLEPGDKFAGFVHGSVYSKHSYGAFSDYIIAFPWTGLKIPSNLSFEEAATLGVGITTVGQALYQTLQLPFPDEVSKTTPDSPTILIYGGTTATGQLAIQCAKLSGAKVITACSSPNFSKVESLGAEKAFDYKDPDCGKKIKEYTNDALTLALDCISTKSTYEICLSALGSSGGTIAGLLPVPKDVSANNNVKMAPVLSYQAIGEAFQKGEKTPETPAKPQDKEFQVIWWKKAAVLLGEGKVKPNAVLRQAGGLEDVEKGLQKGREGVSGGQKMVFSLA